MINKANRFIAQYADPNQGGGTVRFSMGFTMLELIAAIAIAATVMAVSVPSMGKMYQSMQYRNAVKDVVSLLQLARYKAISSGTAQDVRINPKELELRLNDKRHVLPEGFKLSVHSAQQLNTRDSGVIRFYPEGGSSGGGVDLEIPSGSGVKIFVDWLVGRVSQEPYALR